MKKTLSILLALCMLASLCTVPAWAEDETLDLPLIEEVTEEEMELFGEEVELMAENIANVETSETDGITLLSEMTGVTVTAQKNGTGNLEGDIASLNNGQITVGDDLGGHFITNGSIQEGFMIFKGDSITIDFGEKKAFSGIRIWDSSRTRYFGIYGTDGTGGNPNPGARRIVESKIAFSDDGENWYSTSNSVAVHNDEGFYSDLPFTFNSNVTKTSDNKTIYGGVMNIEARYIRFYATTVTTGWGELELEEIAMLDADSTLKTWSLDGKELSNDIIESVTAGSEWNTQSYAITRAYDGNLNLSSYWHSTPSNDTDEARSFTITLKEKTNIGGIRLWPRNDRTTADPYQATASMRKVRLMGSEDGENWYNITTTTSDLHYATGGYSASGYSMPVDVIIPGCIDSNLKYLKVVGEKVDAHVCLAEFQLLSADVKESVSAYLTDDDVVTWKSAPKITNTDNTKDKNLESNSGAFDGKIYQAMNSKSGYYAIWPTLNNDPHVGDWYVNFSEGNSAWMDIDLGKEYTFSAVRLFSRWNQSAQAFTKGYVLVSQDGETWYKSDLYSDSGTAVNVSITGAELTTVNMAKYASTGDIYTDISTSFGEDYNITARYIRILCENTAIGSHWGWQELLLVAPENANGTKTVAEIAAILQSEADTAEATINALGASPEMSAINAARSTYDALPEGAKDLVDASVYKKLTDAEALVGGATFEMAVAQSTGLNKATFTLPVRDNMEIKSVIYTDTLGNKIDGTDATTVTSGDTTMTITMAGGYTLSTGLTSYTDESKGTLYFATANETYGWTAGQEIKSSFFAGSFVRKVTADGIGNHYITITFGDDSTAVVNIKTTADWIQLTSAAAITGSDYTDEITPKTTWKATASVRNRDFNAAFDGKTEYNLNKAGETVKAAYRYESDYVAGRYSASSDLTSPSEQVLLYPPVRLDFIIDTGEATKVSGIRIYPRISSYNEDKTKGSTSGAPTQIRYWGSDDGETWTSLGDYSFGTNCGEKTAQFADNAEYRYYKGSVTRANGNEYKATISISELVFLKAQTILTTDEDVTIDVSDIKAAEFEFSLMGDETVQSLKDGNNNDVAYTFAGGVLTIAAGTINNMADGENALTLTFSNGAEFALTVNKIDTSKASYSLYDENNGTGALVLKSPSGKEVTALKLENGTELTFKQNETKTEITVARQFFRRSTDLYALIDVDKGGEVKVVATYADSSTKTYTVAVNASWTNVSGTSGEFADDEIPAKTTWKARVSSGQNGNQAGNMLSVKKVGKRNEQNWHSFFGSIDGTVYGDSTKAIGHYIDIDFGENVTPYTGLRHLQRPAGTTWSSIAVTGKNNATDEWTEVYSGAPVYTKVGEYTDAQGTANIHSSDILFGKAVSYRYLRLHIKSTSEHNTVDTLHFIKDKITFNGPETVIIDKDNVTDAVFTFHVPSDAEGNIAVWQGSAVDASAYTWNKETGKLTIKADYLKTLGTGVKKVEVQIDSSEYFEMYVELKNYYTETYYFAKADNFRGTENLVLNIPEGKTVSALKYGDKDVAFTQAEGKMTVLRYNFRNLDSFFEVDEIKLTATFTDSTTQDYKITLITEGASIAEGNAAAFLEDEIVSSSDWYVSTMSINSNANGIAAAFSKTGSYWHSAYTEDRTDPDNIKAVADSYEGRHYIVFADSEGVTFSGIRYYARTDNLAGTWDGVSIYARDFDEEWKFVKSQNFDKTALTETRVATVYFDEPVSATQVLIVADASHYKYATAKAITLLKKGATAPDAEEGDVKINVTPTTGGNVYVDGTPSLGANYVGEGEEITLTADAAGFKYWVDAHTGKILGTDAAGLTLNASVNKDVKAVFADPTEYEAFYAFIGRNEGKLVSSGYVKKGEKVMAPSVAQLYTTGYEFTKWVDKNGADADLNVAITADSEFYAVYTKKDSKQAKVTVTGGTVQKADDSDEAAAEATYAYDTKVKAIAAEAEEGQKFAYWTLGDDIVCYTETYIFFVPEMDITLTAVYVAEDETVTKEIGITMTMSTDSLDGGDTLVASFLTTRVVPKDAEVLETGVIYVKDGDVTDLTTDMIGTVTANGKRVKVSLSTSTASGQYKLTAKYTEWGGIAARGFITYKDGDTVKTVYTDVLHIEGEEL